MVIYCASNVEGSPFYKPAGRKPANRSAWIPEVCEVIHPREMAEARALRCFQNLSQLCSQWLRIPQRVTWHTFSDSKYLRALCACPGRQLPPHNPAPWPGLLGEAPSCSSEIQRDFVFESLKGLTSWSHRKSLLPCCCHQKTRSAKIITRSGTLSLSWDICELFIHPRSSYWKTGWSTNPWLTSFLKAKGWLSSLRGWKTPWKFLEQHMRHVT